MKKEFKNCPSFMSDRKWYGFDWLEHVTAIPYPLVLVTSYKGNGKTNATMQLVINFPSADICRRCDSTIENNGYEEDEL